MTRKPGKLFLEILEAKVHAERLRVLQEKFTRLCDLRRRHRLHKCQIGICSRYPMSMPPFTLKTCPVM